MANIKEFLLKSIYDGAGVQKALSDFDKASQAAAEMGKTFSESARLIDQSVTVAFDKAGKAVTQYTSIISDQGRNSRVVWQDLGKNVGAVSTSFQNVGLAAGSVAGDLSKLVSRAILVIPVWEALRFAIQGVERILSDSIRFMVTWETEMTRIQVVTGATKEDIDTLSGALLNVSAKFGLNNDEVAKVTNQWLRMGATLQNVTPLMETTARLALLSGQNLEESAKHVNVLRSAYELSASDTEKAVDQLVAVQQKSGVSLEVLSQAFAKAGEASQGMKVSFSELAGYIAAVNEKTRESGTIIGDQLRIILLRLGTSASKTVHDIAGIPVALDRTGKATMEATGALRPLNDILKDLSVKWETLSNAQQLDIARALGGKYTINTVVGLLSNFNAAMKASGEASQGAASAQKELQPALETTAVKINQLKVAWEQFILSFSNTAPIKATVDILKVAVEGWASYFNNREKNLGKMYSADFLHENPNIAKDVGKYLENPYKGNPAKNTSNDEKKVEKQKSYNFDLLTEEKIKSSLYNIEKNSVLTQEDSLVTIQKKIDLYKQGMTDGVKDYSSQIQSLTLQKDKLLVENQILNIKERQGAAVAQLKADGASELQIAIQQLAYAQAIGNQKEITKAQGDVTIKSAQQLRSVQDDIISALLDEQKTMGETNLQQVQNKIHLEDQLGIHLQGVDLLKQQLELYKAITGESKKTQEQRQQELSNLIKSTPVLHNNFQSSFTSNTRESHLVSQAEKRGISNETIQGILHPNLKSGGENSLQEELKRGLSDPLSTNIGNLSKTIENLAEAITSTRNFSVTGETSTLNNRSIITNNQGYTPLSKQTSPVNSSITPLTVHVGGITVTSTGHSKKEEVNDLLKKLDELVASHLVNPSSKSYKAATEFLNKF